MLVSKPADSSDSDVKFLSLRPIRFIGNVSYSLYLWHWPILTFGTELGFADSWTGRTFLAVLSFGVATLSYYFVELKFQRISIPKFSRDNSKALSKSTWIATSSALAFLVMVVPSVAVQPATQEFVSGLTTNSKTGEHSDTTQTPEATTKPTKTPSNSNWFAVRQAEIASSNKAIADRGELTDEQISEINRVASGNTYAQKTDFTCIWGDCTLGSTEAKIKILILGDSHAVQYQSTFSAMRQRGENIFVESMTIESCPNFSGSRSLLSKLDPRIKTGCLAQHNRVLSWAKQKTQGFDYLVMSDSVSFNPAHYVEDATDYVNSLKGIAKKTVILGQIPWGVDLTTCLNRSYSNYMECSSPKPSSLHDFSVAKNAQVAFADIGSMFCVRNYCPLILGESPVSARDHLTDVAGRGLGPYFLNLLQDAKIPAK
jgi:hypothetical protein